MASFFVSEQLYIAQWDTPLSAKLPSLAAMQMNLFDRSMHSSINS